MKRVLFIHHVSSIGGGSYCLLSILKGIDRTEIEPLALLKEEGPLAEEIRKLGIKVYFFPQIATTPYNQSLCSINSIRRYRTVERSQKIFGELLDMLKVDVVYLNVMTLYPYLRTAKMKGCKTVFHVREHWPFDEHQRQMNRIRKYAEEYADRMVAINGYSASMFPTCRNKITIVHDWIDFKDRYEKRSFDDVFGEDASKLKVFVFTGGIDPIKGGIEIVRTFSKSLLNPNYRLLMLGVNNTVRFYGLRGKVKNLLIRLGWEPYNLKLIKAINNDSRIKVIPPTYKIVDIFKQAYCTLSFYTIPHANLALAEAAILGTVGVAAETEESIEYTDGGKGGLLFRLGDAADFLSKIKYLEDNYAEVKDRVKNHSQKVEDMFNPEKNIEILNKLLRCI